MKNYFVDIFLLILQRKRN